MISTLLWFQLGCVIPYGDPGTLAVSVASTGPETAEVTRLEARLFAELEDETDRDRIERLQLALQLLAQSKTLTPKGQQAVLGYVGALLDIEERYQEGMMEAGRSDFETDIKSEEIGERSRSSESHQGAEE